MTDDRKSKSYFAEIGGEIIGPISSSELRKMAKGGSLTPLDLVWKEGSENRVTAESIGSLDFEVASNLPDGMIEDLESRRQEAKRQAELEEQKQKIKAERIAREQELAKTTLYLDRLDRNRWQRYPFAERISFFFQLFGRVSLIGGFLCGLLSLIAIGSSEEASSEWTFYYYFGLFFVCLANAATWFFLQFAVVWMADLEYQIRNSKNSITNT